MVDLLHGQRVGIELVDEFIRQGANLFVTPHVVYELYRGVRRSSQSASQRKAIAKLLEKFRILPFDGEAALMAARMADHLEEEGLQIPELDLFIAASAIVWGDGVIATRDTVHFRRLVRFGVVLPAD